MKDLVLLMDSELSVSQQCTLVAIKANHMCWAAVLTVQDKDSDDSSLVLVRLHLGKLSS